VRPLEVRFAEVRPEEGRPVKDCRAEIRLTEVRLCMVPVTLSVPRGHPLLKPSDVVRIRLPADLTAEQVIPQSEPDEFGRKPPDPRCDLRQDTIRESLMLCGSFRPIVGTSAHWHR
jgi:hypothetical protein